jgi:hypothetical protein
MNVEPVTTAPLSEHLTTAKALASHQDTQRCRVRRAARIFHLCLTYAIFSTLIWLFLLLTGYDGGLFFGNYRVTKAQVSQLALAFAAFWVGWSFAWYRLKYGLLRRAGLSAAELRLAFSSRQDGFHLESLLSRYSARTLRIIDMVSRRGQNIGFIVTGFILVFLSTHNNPAPESLAFGLGSNLFEATVLSWWGILSYHSNGLLGHLVYGARARVLDGIQGRANVLCINTLWHAFKFVMIPLGFRLAEVYPPPTYIALFAFIWLSYAVADFASDICGSTWGRHRIRVWGLGDLNRKSWAGVVGAFVCTLALNLGIVWAYQLSPAWIVLGVLLAILNPLVELYSPRGTDDFTMATTNALVCLGYGWLVFR